MMAGSNFKVTNLTSLGGASVIPVVTFFEPGEVELVELVFRKFGVALPETLPEEFLREFGQFKRLPQPLLRRHSAEGGNVAPVIGAGFDGFAQVHGANGDCDAA